MLGEDHSLLNEFPEYKDNIDRLNKEDNAFSADAKRYHDLDTEIRKLELDNAPIDDSSLHQMKHDRSVLKDTLYQKIIA
ncbi:MAG: YdcH family protein [Colwellia sp.]